LRDATAIDARLRWYREASEGAMGAQLVLLPETIVPVLAHDLDGWISDLHRRAADANTSVVFGLPVAGPAQARNAVLGVGAARGVYEKRRLVPFAEYVPFERWLGDAGTLVDLPLGRFAHGTRNTLSAGAHRIAAAICYEAAFPELIRRTVREAGTPALLVVPGSDAWFGNAAGRHQILQATRMRAMETGLPVVRSATAGETLVIDARGRVVQRASEGAPWVRASVAPSTRRSAWVRFGSAPVALAALLVLVLAGMIEMRGAPSIDVRSE
jgi:apolipoprotein N-acyltransferase